MSAAGRRERHAGRVRYPAHSIRTPYRDRR